MHSVAKSIQDNSYSSGSAVTINKSCVTADCLLRCFSANVRSLKNKLSEFHYILYNSSVLYDILCLSETWLNVSVSNAMLDPLGQFHVFRKDRNEGKLGGGVCIFIRKYLNAVQIELSKYCTLECLCIDVFMKQRVFRLFNIYRPCGNSVSDIAYMQCLIECLNEHYLNDCINVWLGDLNCPNICWSRYMCNGNLIEKNLFQFVMDSGMDQFVNEATRGDNILDVILCNSPLFIVDTQVNMPVGMSDHCSITCSFNLCNITKLSLCSKLCKEDLNNYRKQNVRSFSWKKANWILFENFIRDAD